MGNLQSQSQPGVDLKQAARFAKDLGLPTYGRYIDALLVSVKILCFIWF